MTQTRREHDDIITAVLHNLVAVMETAAQQSLEQAEIETDQTEAADFRSDTYFCKVNSTEALSLLRFGLTKHFRY